MADGNKGELERILGVQRKAFTAARPEPLEARKDRIKRAIALLVDHGDELARAMSADFGNRSHDASMMTDITGTIGFGKYCLKKLDHWSKAEKRSVRFPLPLLGAKAEVRYEPKGVIGILSPWNFPGEPVDRPADAGSGCRQSLDDQAERVYRGHERTAEETCFAVFRRGGSRRRDRRSGGRAGVFVAAIRSPRFHRLNADRREGDGGCGQEPRAGHTRTRRQKPGRSGTQCRFRTGGRADRAWARC